MASNLRRHPVLALAVMVLVLGVVGLNAQTASRAPAAAKASGSVSPYDTAFDNLKFREIGPAAMGGRVDDFAVDESNTSVVYAALASGGVWKTINGGTTWTPIFDDQPVSTIGDVTLAPSDASIVWVGTGEQNNRQSSSWGNGVYKSTDGGATWKHMGLAETHHIGRIAIHPTNPDVVYVAAVGRLWGPNKERGVFKTTDGGATWKQALYINDDTGVIDLVMDPGSPETLYAGAYERRRTVFGFAGSGPDGGIYKTTDGGANWKKLVKGLPWDPDARPAPRGPRAITTTSDASAGGTRNPTANPNARAGDTAARNSDGESQPPPAGQAPAGTVRGGERQPRREQARPDASASEPPRQEIGRIGLNVYAKDPRIVYALVEHADGGIFRSEDRGETWRKMSDTNPRPMYYSTVLVDPNNDQRIWVLGANMYYSEDGGKTFSTDLVRRIHGDFHAIWIDPRNSDHMITGSDGGIHWSWDRGRTWDFVNNIAIGQFYEIGVDMRQPYYICGGLQDNNTWCGPSASTNPRGIANSDWFTIGGGDGFYAQMDPTDPNIVYAESQDGNVLRRDLRTGESRSIRPQPDEGEKPYRFQWNTPIVISKHDPKTIYYAGNFVFKSIDRGDTWTKISPDLTTGVDRNTLPIMGRVPDRWTRSRHDGVQNWPATTTLAESPRAAQVLWVGTDDGNLQVTRDGGKTWKNVADRVPGVPKGTYVSRVIASNHAEGTAYATFDGHRHNDFSIYVFTTTDFGETWKPIANGIPANNGIVNVIREHPKNPDLLFAGTEYGAYVTFNRGAHWQKLEMGVPTVPVDDIQIHPRDNDLIFGTHGRSIWILDDITPLQELTDQVLAKPVHVFTVRPATQLRPWSNTGETGHKNFFGENPPSGAIISYYLKAALPDGQQVKVTVTDASGKTVRELDGPGKTGINRVAWDTRQQSPIPPAPPGQQGGPGMGFGFFGGGGGPGGAGPAGPRVEPGEYTVKVTADGQEATQKITVQEDPRITMLAADRAARRQALDTLTPLAGPIVTAQRTIVALRQSLVSEMDGWKRPGATRVPENVQKAADDLLAKIDEVYPNFATLPSEQRGLGDAGPPLVERPQPVPQRLLMLYNQIGNTSLAPTAWQLQQIDSLSAKANDLVARVKQLTDEDLAALNKLMNEAGVPHIARPNLGAGGPPRRGPA